MAGREDVTVSFGVSNIGPGPTLNLIVTLLPTGGVTFPSGPVNYGAVPPGGTVTSNFRFSNNAACGATITLTFHLQDGTTDFGNVSIPFTLGVLVTSPPAFTENFDGVTAPALPAGWTTAKTPPTGNPPLWVTSTTTSNTAPNSAFSGGSTTPGDNRLDSPIIAIPNAPGSGTNPGVRLSFKTSYNTEADFDGGVMEISINGGAFQDILAAGGSFLEGGYNSSIGVTDSVLTGRQAWTGNSAGFISTTVILPPASYGQNAQFRWRTAFDTGTSPTGGGLRIDTLSIFAATRVCCGGACVLSCPSNITVPNDPSLCGAFVSYPAPTFTGNCGTVTSSPASGSFFPVGTTTVVVTGTRLDGSTASCSFTVTVVTQLSALSPAKVWIGLKNSDDVGTNFDLLAEVLKNGSTVGTGQINNVPGGSSGFNNAVLRTINLALSGPGPVTIVPGNTLSFRLSVRITAVGGHRSGTARLWYDGKFIDTGTTRDAGSRFDTTIGCALGTNYFPRSGFLLNTTAGSAKQFIDVFADRAVGGNPFKPFGTWTKTF